MFKVFLLRKFSFSSERGVAIAEFAIALPTLAIFIMGVIDVGRMIHQYMLMSHIARESVRVASGILELEAGTYDNIKRVSNETHCDASDQSAVTSSCYNHLVIQRRILQMFRWQNIDINERIIESKTIDDLQVITRYIPEPSSGIAAATDDSVSVQITVPYKGFFPAFDGLNISVAATGPFMWSGE